MSADELIRERAQRIREKYPELDANELLITIFTGWPPEDALGMSEPLKTLFAAKLREEILDLGATLYGLPMEGEDMLLVAAAETCSLRNLGHGYCRYREKIGRKQDDEVTVYLDEDISAAHYLEGYDGPCGNLHGHNWRTEIWLTGNVDSKSGMVIDFHDIKRELMRFDHGCWNLRADFRPTAENIALYFAAKFSCYPNVTKVKIRVWESRFAYAEVSS